MSGQAPVERAGEEILAEALRRARLDLVVGVAGRPLTRVLESLVGSGGARWANHEAVALALALGVAGSGGRSAVLMKQVGLNAGLDVLACAGPHRSGGAMVVIVGDDPGGVYSQIEGDSRLLAQYAEVPCFDVAGGEDLPGALGEALALSARLRVPAVVRVTTQMMMEPPGAASPLPFDGACAGRPFDPAPTWSTDPLGHRRALLADLHALPEEGASLRRPGEGPIRVVASGEPGARVLAETGLELLLVRRVVPAPRRSLADFLVGGASPVLVLEDGRTLLEDEARSHLPSAQVLGRRSGHVLWAGPVDVAASVEAAVRGGPREEPRPGPAGADALADLGDYGSLFDDAAALGLAPVAVDAGNSWGAAYLPGHVARFSYGLGSAVAVAAGLALARGGPAVAAIGDFGVYHAGILGLLQVARDRVPVITVIADNGTAAYTGGQPHPGSDAGPGERVVPLDGLVRGAGIDLVERLGKAEATSEILRPLLRRLAGAAAPSALIIDARP